MFIPKTDNTELIKSLLKEFNDLDGYPLNMHTVYKVERVLRSLNQYVSIIGLDEFGRLGTVDVDMTVDQLRRTVEGLHGN